MGHHVRPCRAMPGHAMPCLPGMPCHVGCRLAKPGCARAGPTLPCGALPCHALACHAMPDQAPSRPATLGLGSRIYILFGECSHGSVAPLFRRRASRLGPLPSRGPLCPQLYSRMRWCRPGWVGGCRGPKDPYAVPFPRPVLGCCNSDYNVLSAIGDFVGGVS